MEEFQEADILWPGSGDQQDRNSNHGDDAADATSIVPNKQVSPPEPSSAPVDISRRKRRCLPWASDEHAMFDEVSAVAGDDDDDDDDEAGCADDANKRAADGSTVVPPHILVARRRLRVRAAAYSMCAGKGRTLKGRDLRDVRNRVLRMTGFIEK